MSISVCSISLIDKFQIPRNGGPQNPINVLARFPDNGPFHIPAMYVFQYPVFNGVTKSSIARSPIPGLLHVPFPHFATSTMPNMMHHQTPKMNVFHSPFCNINYAKYDAAPKLKNEVTQIQTVE